ncbi:MAG: DUF6259 domain-containing protein [Candidatus Hodarchaeota archaeon]
MNDFWFAMYHTYSIKKSFDERALKIFEKDVIFAQEIGIEGLVLEDYYTDWIWGEYTNFWNEKTFQEMIRIIHDYGIKFIPYLDVTELGVHGKVYKRNGRKWGAKNRWGKIYSAFSSIFLADYYPVDWRTKLMCPSPSSGWYNYLTNQAHVLLTQYEVDGIYLDRMDYRTTCYDHSKDPAHFIQGIPALVKSIRDEVKKISSKNLLIINDSCVDPDPPLIKCMKLADFVLTELLPIDTDTTDFNWQFLMEYGDLIWTFHRLIKPIIKLSTNLSFLSGAMLDPNRLQRIINRLKIHVGKNIIVFSHRKDYQGFNAIKKVVEKNNLRQGFFPGRKFLRVIKPFFK